MFLKTDRLIKFGRVVETRLMQTRTQDQKLTKVLNVLDSLRLAQSSFIQTGPGAYLYCIIFSRLRECHKNTPSVCCWILIQVSKNISWFCLYVIQFQCLFSYIAEMSSRSGHQKKWTSLKMAFRALKMTINIKNDKKLSQMPLIACYSLWLFYPS